MNTKSTLKFFKNFIHSSSFGGILLILCVGIALLIANSSLGDSFENVLAVKIGPAWQDVHLHYSVQSWINDGLMAIFFLLVGLEIKRELVDGALSSPKNALLPILAALGGALLPAVIYYLFNKGLDTEHGWGIPMATDIAFALAVIISLGNRVPISLKIFIAALAIVDDLLAILVVAFFYTSEVHLGYLIAGLAVFGLLLFINRMGIRNIWVYLLSGILMWYFIHHSGIHATIAGVLTAIAIPATAVAGKSPLQRIENILAKPVNLLIVPLFALVNTNIMLTQDISVILSTPLGIGISIGLIVGKSIGIFGICFLTVKSGLCSLPAKATWAQMLGVSLLGGIGFTMSIFIANLSFDNAVLIDIAKIAVLVTSLLAAVLGYVYLYVLSVFSSAKATNMKQQEDSLSCNEKRV